MVKQYRFRYGSGEISIPLESGNVISVLEGNHVTPVEDIRACLFSALENPIGSESLKHVAQRADSVVIVVSDMTRFWMRQDLIVPHLMEYLENECLKGPEDIEIVIANGTHNGGSEEELKRLVTEEVYSKVKVKNHDCLAKDLVYLGTTDLGTPVWIDRDAAQADLVICLGAVTYHVMAGFGGGRKSILPGISGLETIRRNHAHSLDPERFVSNPRIGNGVLDGNPLHEDMCQAAGMMRNLFMVNLVTDTGFRLTGITAGHWLMSWRKACDAVRDIYTVPIRRKADVVVTSCGGFPKDESLYQGTKTVDNVISALKDGGTLILLLEGRNGGGSPDYFDWIRPLVEGSLEASLRGGFTVGGYIFFLNCEQARRFNILMYSSIEAQTVAPMGIRAYSDLDRLISDAELEGKSIYVIPTGSTTLPVIGDDNA